ncbi:hypothetical protein BB561_003617 [Smittium simulii]|uniref:Uncharacterized protein n=1 Tax=Smittium simulii TaxID=133385 RepID=A0A2T9YKE7_9FUNG|nr:hypothetical protein BB561_003617 [Smittium simulii]
MEEIKNLKKTICSKKIHLTEDSLRKHIILIESSSRKMNSSIIETNFKLKRLYIYLKQHQALVYETALGNKTNSTQTITPSTPTKYQKIDSKTNDSKVKHRKEKVVKTQKYKKKSKIHTTPKKRAFSLEESLSENTQKNKSINPFTSKISFKGVNTLNRLTIEPKINNVVFTNMKRLGVFNKSKKSKFKPCKDDLNSYIISSSDKSIESKKKPCIKQHIEEKQIINSNKPTLLNYFKHKEKNKASLADKNKGSLNCDINKIEIDSTFNNKNQNIRYKEESVDFKENCDSNHLCFSSITQKIQNNKSTFQPLEDRYIMHNTDQCNQYNNIYSQHHNSLGIQSKFYDLENFWKPRRMD